MKYYPENLIQSTLTAHGAPCTVAPAVLGYTCTTYTAHLDGGNTPTTVKKAIGALEIATGQKITYNANTGVGNTLKITIPNPERAFPNFFAFGRNAYNKCAGEMLIGIDTDNKPITANIMDTLSVLVAGATGSGKSVAVNNLVLSLAIGAKPSEIVFLMIDLKRTEFSIYDGRLPQLIEPVAYTFDEALRLIRVTQDSFFEGLKFAREGYRLSDISHAVQTFVEANGYSVVREYVGHGIGRNMHEAPEVPNYGKPGHGPRLLRGMTLAVEPMVNAGTAAIKQMPDGWTVKTADGKYAAHYENTILITAGDPELLTDVEKSLV